MLLFSLADFFRDLPVGQAVRQHLFDLLQERICGGTDLPAAAFDEAGFKGVGVRPKYASGLGQGDIEACTLLRRVVPGTAQADDRVQHVLFRHGAALGAVFAGMVDQEDSLALSPQAQDPFLYRPPAVLVIGASCSGQRRKVVDHEKVDIRQIRGKSILPFPGGQIRHQEVPLQIRVNRRRNSSGGSVSAAATRAAKRSWTEARGISPSR